MRLSSHVVAGVLATVSALTWTTPALAATPKTSSGVRCTIVGTAANDVLRGTSGRDVICGLGGNDTINAGDGNDIVDGGPGNDMINAQGGDDTVDAGAGNDTIDSGNGDDIVGGGAGNDRIVAASGNDTVRGEAGDDRLDGGAGDDTLDGGAGADAIEGGNGINTCTRDSFDISPATSCTDLSLPTLVASSVAWTAKTYDNSKDRAISVRMRIKDDRSGVASAVVCVQSGSARVCLVDSALKSGTVNDGIWEVAGTLPRYAQTGVWEATGMSIQDRVGHDLEEIPATFPTFAVTGISDTAAPVLDPASAVWNATTFDNSQERFLQVRVRITDDLSGVDSWTRLSLVAEDGAFSGLDGTLISGTATDGVWQFSGFLPQYASTGVWRVFYAGVYDKSGHQAEVPAGFPTFTVTGVGDTEAPVVDVASVRWSQTVLDNSAERTLQVNMRVTDDLSGVQFGVVCMEAPDGTPVCVGGDHAPTLVSGTPNDGIWQFTGTLPAYAPTGVYHERVVQFTDKVGHQSIEPVDFPTFTVTAR